MTPVQSYLVMEVNHTGLTSRWHEVAQLKELLAGNYNLCACHRPSACELTAATVSGDPSAQLRSPGLDPLGHVTVAFDSR